MYPRAIHRVNTQITGVIINISYEKYKSYLARIYIFHSYIYSPSKKKERREKRKENERTWAKTKMLIFRDTA